MTNYKAGTPARCNRCSEKFDLQKDIDGYEFYGREKAARLQEFHKCPHCGQNDCHWIYKADL